MSHIENIKAGNKQSFRWLVETHQQMVFLTAMGFVHVKEDAEDIVQEVFIKVFKNIHDFSGNSEFSTWLYRITINTSINFLNKKKRSELLMRTSDLLFGLTDKVEEKVNPESEMLEKEISNAITKAINSLSNKQQTAFVLSKYDELSQRQIAEIMGITEGAVEQHLQRAKKNLQKKIGPLVGK